MRKKPPAMKLQTHVSINFFFEKFQSCFIRDQRLCWGKPIMISLFQAYSRIASILGFCLDLSQLSYCWSCCFSNPPWTSVGSFWGCIILVFFLLLCIPLLSAGCYSWFLFFSVHSISFSLEKNTILKALILSGLILSCTTNLYLPQLLFFFCWFGFFYFVSACFPFFKKNASIQKNQVAADLKVEWEDDEGSCFHNDKNQHL